MLIRMKKTRIREWDRETVRSLVKKQACRSIAWLGFFLIAGLFLLIVMVPTMMDSALNFFGTILSAVVCIGIPAAGWCNTYTLLQGLREDDIQLVRGICVGRKCDRSGEENEYLLVFSGGGKTWEVSSNRRGYDTIEEGMVLEAAFVGGMDTGLYYSKELGVIERL